MLRNPSFVGRFALVCALLAAIVSSNCGCSTRDTRAVQVFDARPPIPPIDKQIESQTGCRFIYDQHIDTYWSYTEPIVINVKEVRPGMKLVGPAKRDGDMITARVVKDHPTTEVTLPAGTSIDEIPRRAKCYGMTFSSNGRLTSPATFIVRQ